MTLFCPWKKPNLSPKTKNQPKTNPAEKGRGVEEKSQQTETRTRVKKVLKITKKYKKDSICFPNRKQTRKERKTVKPIARLFSAVSPSVHPLNAESYPQHAGFAA